MKLSTKAYENVALLKRWITASEERFVMGQWCDAVEDEDDLTETSRVPLGKIGFKHCGTVGCLGGHIMIMLKLKPHRPGMLNLYALLDIPTPALSEHYAVQDDYAGLVPLSDALFQVIDRDNAGLTGKIWPDIPDHITWENFDDQYPDPADRIRLACTALDNAVKYVEDVLPEVQGREIPT